MKYELKSLEKVVDRMKKDGASLSDVYIDDRTHKLVFLYNKLDGLKVKISLAVSESGNWDDIETEDRF